MGDSASSFWCLRNISWGVTLACTAATLHAAIKWAKLDPRIFVGLAIFATHWALLLPYYHGATPDEMIPAFAGLLLVFAGGPFRRQGEAHAKPGTHERVASLDRYALVLLLSLIIPHFVGPPESAADFLKYHGRVVTLLGTALTLVGFYSVATGVRSFVNAYTRPEDPRRDWRWLAGVLVLDAALEVVYAVRYWSAGDDAMNNTMRILFCISKSVFTLTLLMTIVPYAKQFRKKGWAALFD